MLFFEAFMGLDAVAGDTQHYGVGAFEFVVEVAKILTLQGTARGIVLGIEVQHHVFTLEFGEADGLSARGGKLEVGNGFVNCNFTHVFSSLHQGIVPGQSAFVYINAGMNPESPVAYFRFAMIRASDLVVNKGVSRRLVRVGDGKYHAGD